MVAGDAEERQTLGWQCFLFCFFTRDLNSNIPWMYTDNAVGKFTAQCCKSPTTFSQIKVTGVRILSTSGAFKATWTKPSKAQRGIPAKSFSMAFISFFFCFHWKHERMDWHIKEESPPPTPHPPPQPTYRMLLWTEVDIQRLPHRNVADVWCSAGWYGKNVHRNVRTAQIEIIPNLWLFVNTSGPVRSFQHTHTLGDATESITFLLYAVKQCDWFLLNQR